MPRTKGLSATRLRELARAGAVAALKTLRAEIIAIERTFPELALPRQRRALRRSLKQAANEQADVGDRTQGRVCADEAILGRAPEGPS